MDLILRDVCVRKYTAFRQSRRQPGMEYSTKVWSVLQIAAFWVIRLDSLIFYCFFCTPKLIYFKIRYQ